MGLLYKGQSLHNPILKVTYEHYLSNTNRDLNEATTKLFIQPYYLFGQRQIVIIDLKEIDILVIN